MKNQTHGHLESGQVLFIFIAALVVLLGFTALAIDGGMIYSDRRFDQSVADESALAGAGAAIELMANDYSDGVWNYDYSSFNCSNIPILRTAAILAARQLALTNQFTIIEQDLMNSNHGVDVLCGQANRITYVDKYIDVWVKITSQTHTAFAQLFYPGPILNSVEAIVRIRPRVDLAYGYAIASLGEQCGTTSGGIELDGNNQIIIHGGGIMSNSCIEKNGGNDVLVIPSTLGINFITNFVDNGQSGSIIPNPTQVPVKLPLHSIPVPNCAALPYRGSGESGTLNPGRYDDITLTGNGTITLNPGLYCLYGNVTVNNGSFIGSSVTFIMLEGSFSIGGNVETNLFSPTLEPNLTDGDLTNDWIRGMLIYMPSTNTGQIDLRGNSTSSFTGTIYAPNGQIDIGGTTGINPTYNTQVIGRKVKIHGNSIIDINFQGAENFQIPNYLDMQK
jgi:hypothetical protein